MVQPIFLSRVVVQKAREGALLAPDRLFKVVLVGNSSVGKTSLLRSFCEGRFQPSTIATVGEKEKHCHHVEKKEATELFREESAVAWVCWPAPTMRGET